MMKLINKLRLIATAADEQEYIDCVQDLLAHSLVQKMRDFPQHGDFNCLEHSLGVSYIGFLVARHLGLDARSTARGGLLHDFFLYNWRYEKPYKGMHAFAHPGVALKNAQEHFTLNSTECDIIKKHMWPLTIVPPRCKEAFLIMLVDKYCATMEVFHGINRAVLSRLQGIALA